MHHSVYEEGKGHQVERCTAYCKLFHCPLCPNYKPSPRGKLQKHLDVHVKNAITYKDKKICRCNLNCRTTGHFHCPLCGKTIIRRKDMETHLEGCHGATEAAAAPSQDNPDPSPLLSPSTAPPVPPPQPDKTSPTHTSLHKKVQCPHCKLLCHKKNLSKHIERKHLKKTDAVRSTVKSVCLDASHGRSAVHKARHGFSVPIHVHKKPWGHRQHTVQCELEDCRLYHLMAIRSGLISSQSEQHIRSLDNCTETATEECLKEEVLSEMVDLKFFGEAKKATCLKRQKIALKAHVPLCVEVSSEKDPKKCSFSVHEPALHRSSGLGRAMVTYNAAANTWHCPCATPRLSCVHKNISKWRLFQTNPELFLTEIKQQRGAVCPPSGETLKQLVHYIYKQKKLPDTTL